MSIPGAENPEKVRNIVRGEGALEGFRAMYGDLLSQSAVKWEEGKPERVTEWEWRGQGDEYLTVSECSQSR
jgi:translocator assembly and maintenance protein 41